MKGETNDVKLEYYLGSRDVHDDTGNTGYRTGRAAGSIIVYSLNEAGDELTIEQVLQGNVFEDDADLDDTVEIETESTKVDVTDTAGVADNGDVIFMDGDPDTNNLQYVATTGYDNGYGRITVKGSTLNADTAARTVEKTYAVDLNTVAFYYYDPEQDGEDVEYGVATGWDKMSDVADGTDVQVYPVLEKTTNRTYKASNLAGVILFEAEPNTVAANYMLVLSANAVGKDLLELNVVFEDGTAETIKVDDQGDSFDEDDPDCFMKAWTYSENADGTYDIGSMADKWGTADLLITGTIDLNNGDYLALPSTAKVWDVTEVENANDTVATGRFQENVYVNAVIIVSEGQVRTAWVWDLDEDQTIGSGYNFNWTLTNYEDVYPYLGTWSQWQIQQYLIDGINVRVIGDLTLTGDLYIPEGTILQVEGSLYDGTGAAAGDHFAINGNGTLRVRNDFTVYSGVINVNTQVGDTVGDDLLLGANTTINSRVGVYGDIIGNTVNSGTGHSANRGFNLTVGTGGSVYANRDVEVYYLTVNGHIEANDYHIKGGEVNSARTLIALGSITLYGGELKLGDTATGNATVNGKISGTGDLNVNDGTLTLTRSGSINLVGDVSVGSKGTITQLNGTTHHIVVDGNAYINGKVTIPGTIKATGDVYFGSTANVTLVGDPTGATVTKDPNAKVTIIGGGTDIPEVPEQPVDPADKAVISAAVTFANPVKGEAMPTTATVVADPAGSVTASAITWTPADETAVAGTEYTATLTLTAGEGYKFDATSNVTVNGSAAAVSGDFKAINVTYKYTVPEEGTDPELPAGITGVKITEPAKEGDPYKFEISYTGEEPSDADKLQAIKAQLAKEGIELDAADIIDDNVVNSEGKTVGTIKEVASYNVTVEGKAVGTVTGNSAVKIYVGNDTTGMLLAEGVANVNGAAAGKAYEVKKDAKGSYISVTASGLTGDLKLVNGYQVKYGSDIGKVQYDKDGTLTDVTATDYYFPMGTSFTVEGKATTSAATDLVLKVGAYSFPAVDAGKEATVYEAFALSPEMLDKDEDGNVLTTATIKEVAAQVYTAKFGGKTVELTGALSGAVTVSYSEGKDVFGAEGGKYILVTVDSDDKLVDLNVTDVVTVTREETSGAYSYKVSGIDDAKGGNEFYTETGVDLVLLPAAKIVAAEADVLDIDFSYSALNWTLENQDFGATDVYVPAGTEVTVYSADVSTYENYKVTVADYDDSDYGEAVPQNEGLFTTTLAAGDDKKFGLLNGIDTLELTKAYDFSSEVTVEDADFTVNGSVVNDEVTVTSGNTIATTAEEATIVVKAAEGYYFTSGAKVTCAVTDSATPDPKTITLDEDSVDFDAEAGTVSFTLTITAGA